MVKEINLQKEVERIRKGIKDKIYLIPAPINANLNKDETLVKILESLSDEEKDLYRELEVKFRIYDETISFDNIITEAKWQKWRA